MKRKLIGKKEMARILGVDERTLTRWQEEGLPYRSNVRGKPNAYNPEKVLAWCEDAGKFQDRPPKDDALERERARLVKIKADRAEFELEKRAEQLVDAKEADIVFKQIASYITKRTLAIPGQAADELAAASTPREAEAILRRHIYAALDEMSRYGADEIVSSAQEEMARAAEEAAVE